MSLDRKTTELKALQGLIWKKAYEEGSIKGQLVFKFTGFFLNSYEIKF